MKKIFSTTNKNIMFDSPIKMVNKPTTTDQVGGVAQAIATTAALAGGIMYLTDSVCQAVSDWWNPAEPQQINAADPAGAVAPVNPQPVEA